MSEQRYDIEEAARVQQQQRVAKIRALRNPAKIPVDVLVTKRWKRIDANEPESPIVPVMARTMSGGSVLDVAPRVTKKKIKELAGWEEKPHIDALNSLAWTGPGSAHDGERMRAAEIENQRRKKIVSTYIREVKVAGGSND